MCHHNHVDDLQQEVQKIEAELLEIITKRLEENQMEIEQAQKLAADFLASLPIQDKKDLLEKLKALGANYPEAQQVYVEELKKVESEQRDVLLNQMRDAIHKGDIAAAINIARGGQQ